MDAVPFEPTGIDAAVMDAAAAGPAVAPINGAAPAIDSVSGEPPKPSKVADSSGKAVAKATAGISLLYVLRLFVGFIAQPLIAHNLGLTAQADAFAVSTDVNQRIWLLYEKVINPAFLPNFIAALKEEGEERAWRFASTTIWLVLGSLLVITPLFWVFMPQLVHKLSHAKSPQEIELTIRLARTMLGGLVFLAMSSLTYTILNGYKRFVYAALGDTLWKVGILGGAAVAVKLYGHRLAELAKPAGGVKHLSGAQLDLAVSLAQKSLWLIIGGYLVGSFLKILPHLVAIGPKWKLLKPRVDLSDPLVKKMFALSIPLVLGIAVSEWRGLYLVYLAGDSSIHVGAARAALKFSRIINDNLIQVFPYALSIGIFPYLADQARDRDRQPMTDTLVGALRVCFFTFVPLTAILIAVSAPLLRAVWEGGQLTSDDTIVMTAPFIAFALGMVGFACEMILNQTFYAMTRAWTPTLVGLAATVLWVVIAKAGVNFAAAGAYPAGFALAAIAGSESIAKSAKCLIMWFLLRPQLGKIEWGDQLQFFIKILAGSIVGAVLSYLAISHLPHHHGPGHGKLLLLVSVTVAGLVGLGGYGAVARLLGVPETVYIAAFAGRMRRRLAA